LTSRRGVDFAESMTIMLGDVQRTLKLATNKMHTSRGRRKESKALHLQLLLLRGRRVLLRW
jgi:hypothetical protein